MIYHWLQVALENDPHKKGVGLFRVCNGKQGDERWVWARTKRDALGVFAESEGCIAHKYRAGVEIDDEIQAPNLEGDLSDD